MSVFLIRLHYFFKIFGLSTMSVEKWSKINRYRFKTSRKDFAYSVTLILGFLLFGSYYSRVMWLMDYEGRLMFEKICEVFYMVFAFSVCIALYVLYCTRQRKIVRLADRFYALGQSLAGNSDELLRAIVKQTRMTFRTYLVLCAIFIISVQPMINANGRLDHNVVVGLTQDFILMTVILQYCLVLICLIEMFTMINRHLEGISRKFSHKSIDTMFKSSSNFHTFELYKSQDSQLSYHRSQYYSLCDLSQDISDFFSLPMLMVVSFSFFRIIFSIYYPARKVINQVEINGYTSLFSYCRTWFWFLVTGYLLVVLTNSTARIGKQKERTAEIIIKWSAIVDNTAMEKQV
ncbi:uncharacterized protein LOC106657443 [Trichogramma pretiosum]|uniref:uncharacterized protein LOC106657443 n=1 Tax=Trichogramma pretiosum TaxID=7493 RepID=UPI0006C986DB|nr:uncharacterized protein LOC106657443 [Trichogramma pretiosum]